MRCFGGILLNVLTGVSLILFLGVIVAFLGSDFSGDQPWTWSDLHFGGEPKTQQGAEALTRPRGFLRPFPHPSPPPPLPSSEAGALPGNGWSGHAADTDPTTARQGGTIPTWRDTSSTSIRTWISSPDQTRALLARLESSGIYPLHARRGDDRLWYATLTGSGEHDRPEGTIAEMLDAVERLPAGMRRRWQAARLREFNIGYQCGTTPWAFNQGLTPRTLRRLAAAWASLRITLYPISYAKADRARGRARGRRG